MKLQDAQIIMKWSEDLRGVFTMSDLKVLFAGKSESALYKKLTRIVEEKLLVKVIRGVYAVPSCSLEVISSRLNSESYISTGTVLARKALIGSIPERKVQAVKVGRPRVYEFELGIIEHLSISPELFFGFEQVNSIKYAIPEKAFLDICYFYYKGKRFSFDLESDIDFASLNPDLVTEYLKKYDRRFKTFFRRIWDFE